MDTTLIVIGVLGVAVVAFLYRRIRREDERLEGLRMPDHWKPPRR